MRGYTRPTVTVHSIHRRVTHVYVEHMLNRERIRIRIQPGIFHVLVNISKL